MIGSLKIDGFIAEVSNFFAYINEQFDSYA